MIIDEQKKLVAEKLMGWQIDEYETAGLIICEIDFITDRGLESDRGERINIDDWNPQDNEIATRKDWDEIHEKILNWTPKGPLYVHELKKLLNITESYEYHSYTHDRALLAAKPEIMWEALIKTLEGEK